MKILLGFEVKTGEPVSIPLHHLVITGLTQLSGKTTTLEALIRRSKMRAVIFRTKRGEIGIEGTKIQPFFREQANWMYVESLLEASLRESKRFERRWIMQACEGARSLRQVHANIKKLLEKAKGLSESVYFTLDKYFDLVLPEIERHNFTNVLRIKDGINVMELVGMREEVQALVIRSVVDEVMESEGGVIVVVPEAWKFLPQRRSSPVKWAAEGFTRQGAVLGNYLWFDSQDIANMDKGPLKSVDIWILGRQREDNEAEHTVRQIPKNKPTKEEVMMLPVGHFYACYKDQVRKVYVQPAWLPEEVARRIALGEIRVEEAHKYKHKEDEDMWKEKYEGLLKKFERLAKLEDIEEKYNRSIVELERLASEYEALKKERGATAGELGAYREENKKLQKRVNQLLAAEKAGTLAAAKPGEKPVPWEPELKRTVELEAVELTVNVEHREETVEMSTKKGLGKILFCAIHDLDRKQFTEAEMSKALAERGWYMAHSTLAPSLSGTDGLVKKGYLIKVEKTRPLQYKLPSKLEINVKED